MSATYGVMCDGPNGQNTCSAVVPSPISVNAARALARSQGWTVNFRGDGTRYDKCDVHSAWHTQQD